MLVYMSIIITSILLLLLVHLHLIIIIIIITNIQNTIDIIIIIKDKPLSHS